MKTSKFGAVRLAAAPVLTAATAAATAQATASAATQVVLTNLDGGRTVVAAAGGDVEVRLTAYREQGLNWSWSIPQASTPEVLKRTAGTAEPSGGARAVFHVQHPGTGKITATRHCRPNPGKACLDVVAPWKVTVDVK
ncbi:hypothetical protein F0L68_02355 [Solihabitans fulvus]|uniref:Chagasin family peptidase inhibitor I42 n=1 Tax=Solihabitans fulvus TaxID=1892852 RepID=A0A5B2XUP7_9PSEU|nr:hypothetical protein [Solihabitans fulvus]KAA2266599.1 hypothetical protein F0L68_02355 [Solihabitans fulvus]